MRSTDSASPHPRRSSRRAEILDVFTAKVAAQGYEQASIGDLAQTLDISKGTVVHHFGSKYRLLEEMGLAFMQRRQREVDAIVEDGGDALVQLIAVIHAAIICHRDDRDATQAFTREFIRFSHDEQMASVRAARERYAADLEALIERGMDAGLLRRQRPRLVLLQMIGMCNWAWTWYRPGGALSAEQLAHEFARTLLLGIADDAGRAALEDAAR